METMKICWENSDETILHNFSPLALQVHSPAGLDNFLSCPCFSQVILIYSSLFEKSRFCIIVICCRFCAATEVNSEKEGEGSDVG